MPAPYAFLHPLLAPNRAWAALDWQVSSLKALESTDLIECFTNAGTRALAQKMPFVLSINSAWLMQDEFIQKFETNQIIFVLPENSLADTAAIDQCQRWRKKGYHFALNISDADTIKDIPLAAFDHLEFEASFARNELSAQNLVYTGDAGFKKMVRSVGSHELFDWLASKNFEYCGSNFVTLRDHTKEKGADFTRLKLLKLLSLVAQDADTREIEKIFREEPKLSYNLLRLVNSVAVGAKTTIGSFHQAIAILGRRQLQRWLQLLIYANQLAHTSEPNPLMQLAAARGRQMELLAAAIEPAIDVPDFSDTAFMTGIFSLLDVLLNIPMSEILDALPLQASIRTALDSRQGIQGHLLSAIIAGESGTVDAAAAAAITLAEIGISPASHAKAQIAAFLWANEINLD
jgi:EAL and modified HD-GYP domain-containing signal transduction protein